MKVGDWLTTTEVAGVLGLSRRRVQKLVKDGRIPARRVGRDYLVLRADVARFADSPRPPAGRPKNGSPADPPRRRK